MPGGSQFRFAPRFPVFSQAQSLPLGGRWPGISRVGGSLWYIHRALTQGAACVAVAGTPGKVLFSVQNRRTAARILPQSALRAARACCKIRRLSNSQPETIPQSPTVTAPFTQGGLRTAVFLLSDFSEHIDKISPYRTTLENAPGQKPPLCKGRWHGASRDGGIDRTKRSVAKP